jgi:hypothetical protein
MLFFFFLPFIVLAYINKRIVGYLLAWMLMIACIITTIAISAIGKHPISTIKDSKARTIYHQPWTRYGAYTVGVLFGMMYYEFMKAKKHQECRAQFGAIFYNKVYNSRVLRWFFYLLSSFIMVFLICIPYTETKAPRPEILWPQWLSNFFNAFHRILFVTAMGLFLAGPMCGRSPFMRFVFGGSAWAPWAKLTFIAYLCHVLVIAFIYATTYQAYYMTKRTIFYAFMASLIITYIVTIPISLLIEAPLLQLERLVLFPQKERPHPKDNSKEFQGLLALESQEEVENKPRVSTKINSSNPNKHGKENDETHSESD